jgi:hypothetical protein
MVTVTRSARGLERAMTGKKYADKYDHTQLLMAGRGLEQQVQERPGGLPGGGTQGYDLSLNRYNQMVHEEVEHRPPLEIRLELRAIEQEILQGIEELEGML